jgi:hypothetical protein
VNRLRPKKPPALIPKETKMHYKTIILEMLQARPKMHDQLRSSRTLLSSMNHYASELKDRHEMWKEHLAQAKPASEPSQISSQAMEFALAEMEARLPSESPPDENEPLSLEAAMAFIRKPIPPA